MAEYLKDENRLNHSRLLVLIWDVACPALRRVLQDRYKYLTSMEWVDGNAQCLQKFKPKSLFNDEKPKFDLPILDEWDVTLLIKVLEVLNDHVPLQLFSKAFKIVEKTSWMNNSPAALSFSIQMANDRLNNATPGEISQLHLADATKWDKGLLEKVVEVLEESMSEERLEETLALDRFRSEKRAIKNIQKVRNHIAHQYPIPSSDYRENLEIAEKALIVLGTPVQNIRKIKEIDVVKKIHFFEHANRNFAGRTKELKRIHECFKGCLENRSPLQEERMVVLHGLGGIGKSELARKYAEEHWNDPIIQSVAWINAENYSDLKSSFSNLAHELKIKTKGLAIDEIILRVYSHFSEHITTGLFIFDNAQQMLMETQVSGSRSDTSRAGIGICNFLPPKSLENQPLILITSRYKQWKNVPRRNLIEIQELTAIEGEHFFKKSFKQHKESFQQQQQEWKHEIEILARKLQYFPLAMNFAASNILLKQRQRWTTFGEEIAAYICRMDECSVSWLEDRLSQDENNSKYSKTMNTVWNDTLDTIATTGAKGGKLALVLLNLISYLPTSALTVEKTWKILKSNSFSAFLNSLAEHSLADIREALSILHEHSMVSMTDSRISIHRLVQHCARTKLLHGNNFKYIYSLCDYLIRKDRLNSYWDSLALHLHDYLKEIKWPNETITISAVLEIALSFDRVHCDSSNMIFNDLNAFYRNTTPNDRVVEVKDMFRLYVLYGSHYDRYPPRTDFTKSEIETSFRLNLRHAIEYSLSSPTNLRLEASQVQQYCYFAALRIASNLSLSSPKESLAKEACDIVLETTHQNLATDPKRIKQLYSLLWRFSFRETNINESVLYMISAFRKHFQVRSQLAHLPKEQLDFYWKGGGPLDFLVLVNQCGRLDDDSGNTFLDGFFSHRGLEVFADYLEHKAQQDISDENYHEPFFSFQFLNSIAHKWNRGEKVISHQDFMKAYYSYTNKLIVKPKPNLHVLMFCVISWFGLFSRSRLPESSASQNEWPIHELATNLESMLDMIEEKRFVVEKYFIQTDRYRVLRRKKTCIQFESIAHCGALLPSMHSLNYGLPFKEYNLMLATFMKTHSTERECLPLKIAQRLINYCQCHLN